MHIDSAVECLPQNSKGINILTSTDDTARLEKHFLYDTSTGSATVKHISKLYTEYQSIFSHNSIEIGYTELLDVHIHLEYLPPIICKLYDQSMKHFNGANKEPEQLERPE